VIKIFLTVRNRLAMTAKCIAALKKHSALEHQLYVYDNLTNFKEEEHFMFMCKLYKMGLVTKIVFNTKASTFDAFSKAIACNDFGYTHEMDPKKDTYDYLVFLDNDIIVTPGWDEIIRRAWVDVGKSALHNIKVIGQNPGGIKQKQLLGQKIAGYEATMGVYGGSALWSVKPNFFREIGYLDVRKFVGFDKKHDQEYWRILGTASKGKPYILGLKAKLGIHCGMRAGSICNILTKHRLNPKREKFIRFEESDEIIDKMSFEEFYELISKDERLVNDW